MPAASTGREKPTNTGTYGSRQKLAQGLHHNGLASSSEHLRTHVDPLSSQALGAKDIARACEGQVSGFSLWDRCGPTKRSSPNTKSWKQGNFLHVDGPGPDRRARTPGGAHARAPARARARAHTRARARTRMRTGAGTRPRPRITRAPAGARARAHTRRRPYAGAQAPAARGEGRDTGTRDTRP